MAEAMEYLHSDLPGKKSMIHKDLKPANIMIDSQGTVKILDLGISSLATLKDNVYQI